MSNGTVIVGGSVAGVGAATELRRLGYTHPITVLESQAWLPYDRPPLSKGVLTGEVHPDSIAFHPAEHYGSLGITVRTGTSAVGLDVLARRIRLADGDELAGEAVVIATGARARPFPVDETSGRVWTIRELADVLSLRRALTTAQRVAVIGGGFIGAEVASSARLLGLDVVVVEAARRPFGTLLGDEVAERLARLHHDAGTELLCGAAVTRVVQRGDEQRIHLADGNTIDVGVVIAGLGALPNVEWLDGSGLVVDGSIACDGAGRTAGEGIYAAGDVATWYDHRVGAGHRHEHWTSAREQSRRVAHEIVGVPDALAADSVPYVWSDQYAKRIQVLGYPAHADIVQIEDINPDRGSWLARYGRDGRLVAVVGCNAAARTMRYRAQLAQGDACFEI